MNKDIIFIYPAFPRVFKNFEVLAEAAQYLYEHGRINFKVILTINGNENNYARHIVDKYKKIPTISFVGLKTRDEIITLYQQSSVLVFPSKLETWGLPITEAKQFNIPIILADLPYAHETIGSYDKVKFFNPDDHIQLAECMESFMDGILVYDCSQAASIEDPFAQNWQELFEILLTSSRTPNV